MKIFRGLVGITLFAIALSAHAETCSNYGLESSADDAYYILNNGYTIDPQQVDICSWLVNEDNWGGSLDFNESTGGAGVSITWGKWPWGGEYTAGSFPIDINDPTPQISRWNFSLGTPTVNNWNMFWEIWSQPCTDCSNGEITGDIMIHPTYGEVAGERNPDVVFDGVRWQVYAQPPVTGRNYYIVHYYRDEQTTATGDVDLARFWRHASEQGWATGFVTSITAGLEMSRGQASFQTTAFDLMTQNPADLMTVAKPVTLPEPPVTATPAPVVETPASAIEPIPAVPLSTKLPVDNQAQTCGNYASEYSQDEAYYVLNNGYFINQQVEICSWLQDEDRWGGELDFDDSNGGAGVSITWGKWPWGGEYTAGSFPIDINDPTPQISRWDYTLETPTVDNWNMFWEIWSQPCTDCSNGEITGDIMIHPSYGEVAGERNPDVVIDGVRWQVYAQPPAGNRNYFIVHYYRDEQTSTTGDVDLAKFWRYASEQGWASGYVTAITAGLEMSRGQAAFKTTRFDLLTQQPVQPEPITEPKPESIQPEPVQPEPVQPEPVQPEPVQPEPDSTEKPVDIVPDVPVSIPVAPVQPVTPAAPVVVTPTPAVQPVPFEGLINEIEDLSGIHRISDAWKGRFLHASANRDGAELQSAPLVTDWTSQQWAFERQYGTVYRIRNVWTGRYITAQNNQEWSDIMTTSLAPALKEQLWDIQKNGDYYRIQNLATEMYLHTQAGVWSFIMQADLRKRWTSMQYKLERP